MKKISTTLVLLLFFAGLANAISWNGTTNSLWSTAANWSGGALPTISTNVDVTINTSGPIVNSPTVATGMDIRIGGSSGANLVINSGTLNAGEWIMVGIDQSSKPGTFTMNGGTLNLGSTNPGNGHLWIGYTTTGTFTMNGGAINVPGRFGLSWAGGTANAYLYGGTITAAFFSMTSASRMDITSGTLIVNGDQRTTINGYITSNWMTAFGGTGTLVVDYDNVNSGKTTVTAYLNAQKAGLPTPANNSTDINLDADMSWTAGTGAVSHNVYFGTDNPPPFIGNQTSATFDPGTLEFSTTYYWQIDELNGSGVVTTGDVWNFTTTSGLAKNPLPATASTNVAVNTELHWTSGPGVVSHDVYFGTNIRDVRNAYRNTSDLNGDGKVNYFDLLILSDNWLSNPLGSIPYAEISGDDIVNFADYTILTQNWNVQSSPLFKGSTLVNSFSPGTLALSTTYYWRVDEVNGPDIRKGDIWSFTTVPMDSNYSIIGKVMCGYQGWFNCPGDGTSRGWVHWGNGAFSPTNVTVDMWPDTDEMTTAEKFLASSFYDGSNYYVYSSHNLTTVMRHFQWMQQYGIDGVYLQRFATEVNPGTPEFYHRNDVLSYCKQAANTYGRKYAVMYDLSGLGAGGTNVVINDWKYLVDTVRVGKDPCDRGYMRHNNKPVVAVWGIGWSDRQYTSTECRDLVNFLKNDPVYGGNIVMIGVKDSWRTNSDPMIQATLQLADIISPWLVGKFSDTSGVNSWAGNKGINDKNWCNTNGKYYLPVIYPGFSWHNLNGGLSNQIPRWGGQFLWDQTKACISTIGANMLYVAMFDEVDEGTAIFKVSNHPPVSAPFVSYRQDLPGQGSGYLPMGAELPSDEYLWLTGQVGRALRGEITVTQTRPAR